MLLSPLNRLSPLSPKRTGGASTLVLTTASTASANIRIDTKSGGTFKVDWGQGTPTITASNVYENKTYSPNYSGDVIVYNRNDIDGFQTTDGAWNFDVALLPKSMTGSLRFQSPLITITGNIANTSQLLTGSLWFQGDSIAVTGDIANTSQLLTGSLSLIGNSMTIYGDIANTPQLLTGSLYFNSNSITITGNIANTSQLLTGSLWFQGDSIAVTGDIANTSQLLTGSLSLIGNSMTIYGDIANTSQLLTGSLYFFGNSMTITGDIANTSQLLTVLEIQGNSITITGNIANTSPSLTHLYLQGNLMTTYGDIAAVASGVRHLRLNTPLGEYTYTAGRVWANMTHVLIRPKAGFITSTEADNIFIDIDNSPLAVAGGTIDLRGNCGAVTSASAAARSSLAGKGYTCLFNI